MPMRRSYSGIPLTSLSSDLDLSRQLHQRGGQLPRTPAIGRFRVAMACHEPGFNAETAPMTDRTRAREMLLRRWDAWQTGLSSLGAQRQAYLMAVRQRFVDGIGEGLTVCLDDWPMDDPTLREALNSLMERVIEPSAQEMDASGIAKEQVGLVVSLPAEPARVESGQRSAAGHDPQEPTVAIVGEQVEPPVRTFAHIADTGVDVGQHLFFPDMPAILEHQP